MTTQVKKDSPELSKKHIAIGCVTLILMVIVPVLMLSPFVILAAHTYDFNLPLLVVEQVSPDWVFLKLLPVSAVLWLLTTIIVGGIIPYGTPIVIGIGLILAALTGAPYLIMLIKALISLGLAVVLGVVYTYLLYIVIIGGILIFLFDLL